MTIFYKYSTRALKNICSTPFELNILFITTMSTFWASLIAQLVKESACNAGDLASIPGLGRSPGEGRGYPLQYSGLENSMDSPWGRKESDMTEQLSLSLQSDI